MHLLVNAAFNTRAAVGITHFLLRLVPQLSRLCELTVLTPDPGLFDSCAHTVKTPESTRFHNRQVMWGLTSLRKHCQNRYTALLSVTPIVPPACQMPAVAVVHDITPLAVPGCHDARYKFFFWLSLQTLRWADAVVAVSGNTKRDLARMGIVDAARIHVVHEGPGIEPSVAAGEYGLRYEPFVLYVGGHQPHKNLRRLIPAFAVVAREAPALRLVVVGGGSPEHVAATTHLIRRLGMEGRVVLLEDLSDAQLSSLYRHSLVLAYPSLYEGFGLPILEAQTHGTPVVCSRATSIPEVAGEAAVYFDPLSVRGIALALRQIIDHPDFARRLGCLGRQHSALFSWAAAASEIVRVIETTGRSRV